MKDVKASTPGRFCGPMTLLMSNGMLAPLR